MTVLALDAIPPTAGAAPLLGHCHGHGRCARRTRNRRRRLHDPELARRWAATTAAAVTAAARSASKRGGRAKTAVLEAVEVGRFDRIVLALVHQATTSFARLAPPDRPQFMGVCQKVEPIIDGVSLVDLVRDAGGSTAAFAGMDPGAARPAAVPQASPLRVQVLGCVCGVDDCSGVTVVVAADADHVQWSDFDNAGAAELGPFRFERAEYERTIGAPTRSDAPVRRTVQLAQLLSGIPSDHNAWLSAAARYADDHWNDEHLAVLTAGFQWFVTAGNPVCPATLSAWQGQRAVPASLRAVMDGLLRAAALHPSVHELRSRYSYPDQRPAFVMPSRVPHAPGTTGRLERWLAAHGDDALGPRGLQLYGEESARWILKVDLSDGVLAERPLTKLARRNGLYDFASRHLNRSEYFGSAGPLNLDELLTTFLDWAEG